MAGSERTPLLDDDDEAPVDFLMNRASRNYVQFNNDPLHQNNSNIRPIQCQQNDRLFGMTSESDHIVAVFVIAFDTKAGLYLRSIQS